MPPESSQPQPSAQPQAQGRDPEEVRNAFLDSVRSIVREEVDQGRASVDEAINAVNKRTQEIDEQLVDVRSQARAGIVPGSGDAPASSPDGFNLGRVVQSVLARLNGDSNYRAIAPAEWEMSDFALDEMRAQGTAPDTSGGFIVPGQIMLDQFVPLLRPQVIVLDLGATTFQATTTPLEIPTEASPAASAAAVAENVAAAETSAVFGQLRMEPHTCASFIKASRRFMEMGASADTLLRQILSREIGIEWNRWALRGTGADDEPTGILNSAGINSVDFDSSGSGPKDAEYGVYTKLLEMEDAVADANALQGTLGWACSNRFVRALRQLKSEKTDSAWGSMTSRVIAEGPDPTILGYPYRRSTQLVADTTNTEAIFGDWSQMIIPNWGALVIEASNVANDALQKRQTHIVAYIDIDVGVRQPSAFAVTEDYLTTAL